MNIAQRILRSSVYNVSGNLIQNLIHFGHSVALARLLVPEVFGVYVFVSSIVTLTRTLPHFGLSGALFAYQGSDREKALQAHFTLTFLFHLIWLMVMVVGVALFASETRWVFFFLIGSGFISQFSSTPRALLIQQVEFRRIAIMETAVTIVGSGIAVGMAWYGYGIWSLLISNIAGSFAELFMLYGPKAVWRPKLSWSKEIVAEYLIFGSKVLSGSILLQALDRVDDIWTGFVLGDVALGFYSRAYRFASYPRKLLSKPVNDVALGAYAHLKTDRKRLSQVFFRFNALLIRGNFLLTGCIVLAAPEFIRLVLGSQWLPMLDAFRLMLIYTLLDPIKQLVSNLFIVVGSPGKLTQVRFIQLLVMVIGLVLLGPWLGIAGVALAVNLMMAVGIVLLFFYSRTYVDYSVYKLFGYPALSLLSGLVLARLAITLPGVLGSDWRAAGLKLVVFASVYSLCLLVTEKRDIFLFVDFIRNLRYVAEKS